MSLPPVTVRRILREISTLANSPPQGVRLLKESSSSAGDNGDLSEIRAWIEGPTGTPFHGGFFKIRLSFGDDYPAAPPKCTFVTKIFHPNVNPSTGEICVDTLKNGWESKITLAHILLVIKCLLIHPNPASALHAEAGKLLTDSFPEYSARAKLFTSIHAISPSGPPSEFDYLTTIAGSSAPLTKSAASNYFVALGAGGKKLGPDTSMDAERLAGGGSRADQEGSCKQENADAQVEVEKEVVSKPVKVVKKRGLKRL